MSRGSKIYTIPDREKEEIVFEVANISKRFGDHVVLDDVSFFIPKGEFLCLCGPNGAGKSTFLKIVLGLLDADTGTVEIHGQRRANSKLVGYVPQRKRFHRDFPARVEELIAANLRGKWPLRVRAAEKKAVEEALERVGGSHLYGKMLAGLSGGEMQRAFLARALVTHPPLLILDEPTAGVDVSGREEFIEILYQISKSDELAAILVSHHLGEVAKTAERVLYLQNHVVAWGLPDELLGHEDLAVLKGDIRSTRYDSEIRHAKEKR